MCQGLNLVPFVHSYPSAIHSIPKYRMYTHTQYGTCRVPSNTIIDEYKDSLPCMNLCYVTRPCSAIQKLLRPHRSGMLYPPSSLISQTASSNRPRATATVPRAEKRARKVPNDRNYPTLSSYRSCPSLGDLAIPAPAAIVALGLHLYLVIPDLVAGNKGPASTCQTTSESWYARHAEISWAAALAAEHPHFVSMGLDAVWDVRTIEITTIRTTEFSRAASVYFLRFGRTYQVNCRSSYRDRHLSQIAHDPAPLTQSLIPPLPSQIPNWVTSCLGSGTLAQHASTVSNSDVCHPADRKRCCRSCSSKLTSTASKPEARTPT